MKTTGQAPAAPRVCGCGQELDVARAHCPRCGCQR